MWECNVTELKTWIKTQLFFFYKRLWVLGCHGSVWGPLQAWHGGEYTTHMSFISTKYTTMFLTLVLCRLRRRRRPSSWCEMPSLQVSLMTWALAATLTCVLSPRARWTTCGPMMRPTRRASGENCFVFSFDSFHTRSTGWNKLLICCHGEVYFQT